MKQSYRQKAEEIVQGFACERKRLLLHSCCGPCSTSVLEFLTEFFDVTVLFFNPNIQPAEEYEKRLFWQRKVTSQYPKHVDILECSYEGGRFNEAASGLEAEPEGGARCESCFRLRLSETSERAKLGNFDYFSTTLTVSPHKNADIINEIGFELAEKNGVSWLPSDFKKKDGYKRSIELSKEYGLYRQQYCGCLYCMPQADRVKA